MKGGQIVIVRATETSLTWKKRKLSTIGIENALNKYIEADIKDPGVMYQSVNNIMRM